MKHLKVTYFALIVLFVNACTLTGCSDDNEVSTNDAANKNVNAFLRSFYSQDFHFGEVGKFSSGKASHVSRSVDIDDEYLLTEVFVGNDPRPRGYMITEKSTSDLQFFLDVDRTDFKLTTFDPKISSTMTFEDINQLERYYLTDEFDFIKVIEDPAFEPPVSGEPIALRIRYSYGAPFTGPDGNCYQGVYQANYIAGIRISKVKPTMVVSEAGNLVHAVVQCGTSFSLQEN